MHISVDFWDKRTECEVSSQSCKQVSLSADWSCLSFSICTCFVWTIWYMTNWLSDNNLLESWNHEKHLLSLLYKIKLSANTIELLENLNGGYIKHPEINSFLMFIKYNRLAGIGVYWRSKCMLECKDPTEYALKLYTVHTNQNISLSCIDPSPRAPLCSISSSFFLIT